MLDLTSNYTCPNCGAVYHPERNETGKIIGYVGSDNEKIRTKCESCREVLQPQKVTDLKPYFETPSKSQIATARMKQNIQANKDITSLTSLGLFYLINGGYMDAKNVFSKLISLTPQDSDAYLYFAIASLEGKKPFVQQRYTIDIIEENLNMAVAFAEGDDEKLVIYNLMQAYIRHDYFARKFFDTTSYKDLLYRANVRGLTFEQKQSLFNLLKTTIPSEF